MSYNTDIAYNIDVRYRIIPTFHLHIVYDICKNWDIVYNIVYDIVIGKNLYKIPMIS